MPNVQLLRILEGTYARAKGELLSLEQAPKKHHVRLKRNREQRTLEAPEREVRAQKLQELLDAIETVIRWELPDWDPDEVKPVRPIRRHQPIGMGALSNTAKDIVREGGSRRVTVREVTQIACQRLGLEWTGDNRERYRDAVGSALARLARNGLIEDDGADRERRYWLSDEDDD